jgi:hypothetical protein
MKNCLVQLQNNVTTGQREAKKYVGTEKQLYNQILKKNSKKGQTIPPTFP